MNALQPAESVGKPPVSRGRRKYSPSKRLDLFWIGAVIIIATSGLLVCPALLLAWVGNGPTGVGEYRDSPDDRYRATVDKMRRSNWTGEIEHYVQFKVVERIGGRQVWHVIQRHAPDVEPPHYEMRGRRFIEWAADSKSLTVPVVGGRAMTFDVP